MAKFVPEARYEKNRLVILNQFGKRFQTFGGHIAARRKQVSKRPQLAETGFTIVSDVNALNAADEGGCMVKQHGWTEMRWIELEVNRCEHLEAMMLKKTELKEESAQTRNGKTCPPKFPRVEDDVSAKTQNSIKIAEVADEIQG